MLGTILLVFAFVLACLAAFVPGPAFGRVHLGWAALKVYTPDQSRQLGEARRKLRAADPQNILLGVTDDYGRLREQCRAIGK